MAELTKLGRYQLRRVLGRGAMGVVYEGLDPSLNRRVAVKTILRNAAIDEETAQHYSAQFAREARAAGRLNHPNIVQVHDFAEEGDVAYLVMEFIEGRELRSFFEARETFAPAEVVRIMGELLDALDFAHEAGVIHRDVKPANVMLDARKRVKLADFGVARIQDSERSAAGTMVGTPAFMSPEQISGAKIDRRTDIFSAGVVLYQLLTGEQPFTGEGAWTVAKKIMQDDPPHPSSVAKSVSPVFDGIVRKALAKSPEQRYASAHEFAVALRSALAPAQPAAAATIPPAAPAATSRPGLKASEAEVEFWKAIQNSTDAAEFEFYLEQFPEGTYAALARHKIAKLKGAAKAEDTVRLEAEAAAKRAAAEEKARREAEEKAKQEAYEKAEREAAEKARREAEEKARREAEEKARREAAAKAKREAEERLRRETEEKVRQAQALARLKAQEEAAAKARAKARADEDSTVALPPRSPAPAAPTREREPAAAAATAPPEKSKSMPVAAAIAAVVVIGGVAAYF
ncbi:MAG: serine/threonine protein kinase, partial [Burkholderiales bacterium]|nr:serine/threonine protein kinase [Burkholderiales bacterium]